MFPESLPFEDMVSASQARDVKSILDRVRGTTLPEGAVTFWGRGKEPRRQIYVGPISEDVVRLLRKVVGPRIAVSIVRDAKKNYRVWKTLARK